MSRRTLFCVVLVSAVGLAGCTDAPKPKPPAPSSSTMRLVAFDSCAQLRDDLRAAAQRSVGPWGLPGGMQPATLVAAEGARTSLQADAAGKVAAPVPAFSGTNVHETGADEPDIVKTDGRRIVTVSGGVLRVVDASTRQLTGKLDLTDKPAGTTDLLLSASGDAALVLMSGDVAYGPTKRFAPTGGRPQALLVDLTGTPRVISRYDGEGALVDARQTGNTARVVLRSLPKIEFMPRPQITDDAKRIAANRKQIARAGVDAWLPSWSVTTGSTTTTGTIGCGQVRRPTDYSGASLLTILTFDLGAADLGNGDPLAIVADGETVYGNGTNLYVANDQRWRIDPMFGPSRRAPKPTTEIYRFDVAGDQPPRYVAAGTVPGWLINQYALSEWDNRLRVATTDDSTGKSAVRVLEQHGDALEQVGVVDGLGKGERIYSVRFIGPRGYVVTFRQTDPLYSLDLSDPAKPAVTGELKITGYSSHLQPAGDGRLIGIGQGADDQGIIQGTQVSLFDVSDPAAPRRLSQMQVTGGQSEAEWDPHALLWWPQTNLLVIPAAQYGPEADGSGSTALALRVTDEGIERIGTIVQPRSKTAFRGWAPGVRRSLVIGNTLWTMSDDGLQASDMSTLDRVAWVPSN